MSETNVIRVMVVDDHPVVRDGLKLFLTVSPDLECVGEAGSGEEALQRCAEVQPDVILMDLNLPGMDGAEATKQVRQQYPQTQVIALTSIEDKGLVQKALQAGAISYLLKNISMDMLSSAIRSAVAGQSTLSPEATQALMQAAVQPPEPEVELTDRELEVLALLADGLTNDAIGYRLHISPSTTRYHVSNILGKMNATNRTEAVRLAIEGNLLPKN